MQPNISSAPVFCSCTLSLLYTLYLFVAYEESNIHHAQEFENRFWTILALLFSTALFFAKDSPFAIGNWSPSIGFTLVISIGYGVHAYDRYLHRQELIREHGLRRGSSAATSLNRLKALGIPVEEQLDTIHSCLSDIDQLLIPSTLNNIINLRFILKKEREIIQIFEDVEPKALNYLVQHVRLGLLFYKVKDHRNFSGKHRSELIECLCVTRISALNVLSKVFVLHALQMLKLPANPRAEHWVRNILLNTSQDDLSELKTLTDSKGDYFCMMKLIFVDIRSQSIQNDLLRHIRKEANIQQAHMVMGTKKSKIRRSKHAWRKILSDVDDTLYCSGGAYPAGIDKRYGKKVVYPGVLSFYRELDLGIYGPEIWPPNAIGNLVFLSARPHLYKDVSEKHNFAKFEKLRNLHGMHTNPSLMSGDLTSGQEYILKNDMYPLALKKFENFQKYVSIYPEFKHIFIGDNGQGDVRAAELMYDSFPDHLEAVYMHVVKPIERTYGYDPQKWREKKFKPYFFHNYVDAALHAASSRNPPLITTKALKRICEDVVREFKAINMKQWPSPQHLWHRKDELNQDLWKANLFLSSSYSQKGSSNGKENAEEEPSPSSQVDLLQFEQIWNIGDLVHTPYGNAKVIGFPSPEFDLYEVILNWKPIDVQLSEYRAHQEAQAHTKKDKNDSSSIKDNVVNTVDSSHKDNNSTTKNSANNNNNINNNNTKSSATNSTGSVKAKHLETVVEGINEVEDDFCEEQILGKKQHEQTGNLLGKKSSTDVNGPVHDNMTASHNVDTTTTSSAKPLDISSSKDDSNLPELQDEVSVEEKHISFVYKKGSNSSDNEDFNRMPTKATIRGIDLTKFKSPSIPVLSSTKSQRSIFSFWVNTTTPTNASNAKKNEKKFTAKDKCATPYGVATVIKPPQNSKIMVVKMQDWNAMAYLQQDCVKFPVSDKQEQEDASILSSLLRKLSTTEGNTYSGLETSTVTSSVSPQKQPQLEFPHVLGTIIHTPFGEGHVCLALPHDKHKNTANNNTNNSNTNTNNANNKDNTSEKPATTMETGIPIASSSKVTTASPMINLKSHQQQQMQKQTTIGISLVNWTLADETHPTLYCIPEVAKEWKENNKKSSSDDQSFVSVVLGSIIRKFSTSTNVQPQPQEQQEEDQSILEESNIHKHQSKYEQYFSDGATVSTPYGEGKVLTFREDDGFYEISLINWTPSTVKIEGGSQRRTKYNPTAFLQKDSFTYKLAQGCREGYPVLTTLGLSGHLAKVIPQTSIHVVTISNNNSLPSPSSESNNAKSETDSTSVAATTSPHRDDTSSSSIMMVCYLQPQSILMPLKAAVFDDVLTPYGEGKVTHFRLHDNTYHIKLKGWNATLYITSEVEGEEEEMKFDRIDGYGMNINGERHSPFGINWLLNFLFYNSSNNSGPGTYHSGSQQQQQQRSRSSSFGSMSTTRSSIQKI